MDTDTEAVTDCKGNTNSTFHSDSIEASEPNRSTAHLHLFSEDRPQRSDQSGQWKNTWRFPDHPAGQFYTGYRHVAGRPRLFRAHRLYGVYNVSAQVYANTPVVSPFTGLGLTQNDRRNTPFLYPLHALSGQRSSMRRGAVFNRQSLLRHSNTTLEDFSPRIGFDQSDIDAYGLVVGPFALSTFGHLHALSGQRSSMRRGAVLIGKASCAQQYDVGGISLPELGSTKVILTPTAWSSGHSRSPLLVIRLSFSTEAGRLRTSRTADAILSARWIRT